MSKFLKALNCKNEGRPPIWIMRQAGRYLPEYRLLREKYSFHELSHHPELITKVTLQPIERFGMDAAILFSDILVLIETLGKKFVIQDKIGPIIDCPLLNPKDIDLLPLLDVATTLDYVAKGIRNLKTKLNIPLIGFCGAPFTLASYLIEGGSSKDFKKTKKWMLQDPKSFHILLDKLATQAILFLKMQIAAGVQAIQIFDSWANVLGHVQFREFSLAYIKKIVEGLSDTSIPTIVFCRGSSFFASQLTEIPLSCISLDWQSDILNMRKIIPPTIALQGNLDPHILYADKNKIREETFRILEGLKGDSGYIFNLGHGILPDIPLSSVQTLVETVQNYT